MATADSLLRYARAELAPHDPDHRRLAIAALEQAARLEPADPKYTLALGEAYFEAEFTERARSCFERVRDLEPQSAEPYLRLGEAYKRRWIDLLDRDALDHAIENFGQAAQRDSELCDAWVQLAPLLFEVGAGQAAADAAQEALQAAPEREDALLAAGYLAYRAGSVTLADSLLNEAVARMSPTLRDRFEDIAPLVPDADTLGLESMSPADRAEWLRRFWSRLDPDPTTPANEARLEYWSRVAHATLLFSDRTRTRWDMRAQLYVRYGAPTAVARDPYTLPLWRKPVAFELWRFTNLNGWRRVGEPTFHPQHMMLVNYRTLGMTIVLQDPTLSGNFRLPMTTAGDPEPVPSPVAVSEMDLMATQGGRAVFPKLPPGTRPMPVSGRVSTFRGATGSRLLVSVETPGGPGDSLGAEWVALDARETVVARGTRGLSVSGCDPAAFRTADFAAELPAGDYRIAVAVSDGQGRRGVFRTATSLPVASTDLAVSDLVIVCGPPEASTVTPDVRLSPKFDTRVTGAEPLVAYFEVYGLRADASGLARFEYEYTVRPMGKTGGWWHRVFGGGGAKINVSFRGENAGPLRRQFITVPVQSLPEGTYRLEVRVRDLNAAGSVLGTTSFERVGVAVGG